MTIRIRSWFARAAIALSVVLLLAVAIILARTAAFGASAPRTPLRYEVPALDAGAAARNLGAAIRFETVIYDDGANTAAFEAFRQWLVETYPRVHASLRREVVGGGTLIYEWPGADATLRPIVLMAHQDVVPVSEPQRWRHPPFSGALIGGEIWGRGALDNKGPLIAIFEAMESLLAANHAPARGFLFVFGHDEESGGNDGARVAAELLARRGVRAEFVLDEAGLSLRDAPLTGKPLSLIGVAEKGLVTLQIEAEAVGGHSSTPGRETAVDTLAQALIAMRASPFQARYSGVTRDMLEQMAPHAPFMARMAIANRWAFEPLLMAQLGATPPGAATLQTTVAPTMLQGSPKSNVLPSVATATINFRILPGESIDSVTAHVRESVRELPVTVSVVGQRGEPSPVASTGSGGYRLIAGLAAQTFDAPVAPLLVTGITDSRFMRLLTSDIYRFTPMQLGSKELGIVHGIDERVSVENFERMLSFYRQIIVGGGAARLP